jgi:hypothetical protein
MPRSGWLGAWFVPVLLVGVTACGGDSGTTGPPAEKPPSLTIAGGSGQTGQVGTALEQPLTVLVRNSGGTPLSGVTVSWATTGGGSFEASGTQSSADGIAAGRWTLGSTAGQQTATASLSGATGSPVTFAATATAAPPDVVTISGVNPSPMIEGQSATVLGTGFGTSAAALSVTIEGATVTVTQVTSSAITVTVPTSNCRQARSGDVSVTRNGIQSNAFSASIAPAAFLSLNVGKQVVLQDPATFCLQFAADVGSQDYLIGVQSASEVVSNLTPATLTASANGAVPPLPALSRLSNPAVAGLRWNASAIQQARTRRWEQHRAAEMRIRRTERALLTRARLVRPGETSGFSAFSAVVDFQVGDTVTGSVPDYLHDAPCTPIPVTAVVRTVGTRGIWLEDVDNPTGGYTSTDFDELSAQFDNLIYATDVAHFGDPTDLDATGHIFVLITKETNRTPGLLGFVSTTDLFSQASCASSNQGEIFYGAAPDPTGIYPFGTYPAEEAKADAPFLIAHEFTHIIQLSRRLYIAQGPIMASWTAEGQATLAEEIVGFAAEGHTVGQNLGFDVAVNLDDPSSTDWYSNKITDLAIYYGYQGTSNKVAGAPGECSWLDKAPANPGPCLAGREIYGVPWSLLRWLSDQYGPSYAGGEAGLQQALINSTAVGYENLATVVGVPMKTLLARWAAALYVDDRVPEADLSLTMSTWNLYDIFDAHLVSAALLTPTSRGFGAFTESVNVRAGSTAYFRVSGASHPATSVKIRGAADAPLPSNMQVFVVRLR